MVKADVEKALRIINLSRMLKKSGDEVRYHNHRGDPSTAENAKWL